MFGVSWIGPCSPERSAAGRGSLGTIGEYCKKVHEPGMLRRKNDQDLFEALVTPQLDAAYRFALHLTHNEADAEDLLQEACQLAFGKFQQFQRGTNFKAWLFRIVRNRHIDHLRRKRIEPGAEKLRDRLPASSMGSHGQELSDPRWTAENAVPIDNADVFYDLFGDEVNRFLAELPVEFRISVVLCDVDGFSYEEISAVLDCPIGTVRSRISRARSFLREKLFQYAKSLGYVRNPSP
jgi:RNA polymerase sigma-70 factor (ECF subfamily)